MLINRDMRIALLISFFCHLFCIFSFSIVFLSSGLKIRQYYSVNFLGSIFGNRVSLRPQPRGESRVEGMRLEAHFQKRDYFREQPPVSLSSERRVVNPDTLIDPDASYQQRPFAASFIQEPEAPAQRKAIFKPAFSVYPEWRQKAFKGSSAVFRVCILADGLVQQAINVKTCGDPEIDAALARYLRAWRFAPVAGQKAQWQTIEIKEIDDKTGI